MGGKQSSEGPGTWSIQAVDPVTGEPLGEAISGVDSGTHPDPVGDFFGGIGDGIADIWNMGKDAFDTLIHLPGDLIHEAGGTVRDVAHEAGGAVANVTGAAESVFSSPAFMIGGAAVLLIVLSK